MTSAIYKILPLAVCAESLKADELIWLPVDKADGFLHFSTRAQLPKTLEKHFRGQKGLVILEVSVDGLHSDVARELKWEKNHPEGDAYPHLYTGLSTKYVTRLYTVISRPDGGHSVPELF